MIEALASKFERVSGVGLLEVAEPHRAATQFAYLVAGAPLDRAILVGTIPSRDDLVAGARDGVETFLARYGVGETPVT